MKVQAKLYGTVHEKFVFIAYASSKGSDESAHLRSIPITFAARTERMKRCRWRFRPNSVPCKAVVVLLIHSLMFLQLDCGGSAFGSC